MPHGSIYRAQYPGGHLTSSPLKDGGGCVCVCGRGEGGEGGVIAMQHADSARVSIAAEWVTLHQVAANEAFHDVADVLGRLERGVEPREKRALES